MYKHFFKRLIDFSLSLLALVCLSPLLLMVTVWLLFANKGAGAFFFQERPGKNAKIFKVIKFKTMTDERDADGNLLPDSERLTKVGRFIRYLSSSTCSRATWHSLGQDLYVYITCLFILPNRHADMR